MLGLAVSVCILASVSSFSAKSSVTISNLHEGDIIFQTSKSSQSKAILMATHSKYSHMGIVYRGGKGWYV